MEYEWFHCEAYRGGGLRVLCALNQKFSRVPAGDLHRSAEKEAKDRTDSADLGEDRRRDLDVEFERLLCHPKLGWLGWLGWPCWPSSYKKLSKDRLLPVT
jgi:hypothetical protein